MRLLGAQATGRGSDSMAGSGAAVDLREKVAKSKAEVEEQVLEIGRAHV